MGFEVFDKRNAPLKQSPSITIQKRGIFSITSAAFELIGRPATVEMLWDKDRRIIGIRGVEESPHSYRVRAQSARETGQVVISATAFTQYYEIDTEVSRRWKPFLEGDVLCIDLNQEGTIVRGNRSKSKPEEHSAEDTPH
jgi:hypothetical protein